MSLIKQVKIGRPSDEKGKSPVICIRIEEDLLSKIDLIADKNSCSRSSVVIHALLTLANKELQ